jgi:mRNA interferase MazF
VPPRRGEVYWIDWEPHRGSEQAGRRPGLVISGDAFNSRFRVCTTLALTTQVKDLSRVAVTLDASVTGKPCQVLTWQVMTISQDRLLDRIAALPEADMRRVDEALRFVWAL